MNGIGSTSMSTVASTECAGGVDFIEAGAGPLVVLVHSSMSGARQWSALTHDLEDHFQVRAVNLFGYGGTPAWSEPVPPSLDDFAELVAAVVPSTAKSVHLVGHSLGGAVVMQAAACQLRGRVESLVLIEPSLFYLLDRHGRREAFCEILALATYTKRWVVDRTPEAAAERFIDYWGGPGAWAVSSPGRKSAFARAATLLPNEWNALLTGTTSLDAWAAALPPHTLVMSSVNTVRPSREIVELLLQTRADWEFVPVHDGGHMAPLTHSQLINPVIRTFITDRRPGVSNQSANWPQPYDRQREIARWYPTPHCQAALKG
jgi:pimeloyl-ACP methyl ester carboxylesterase